HRRRLQGLAQRLQVARGGQLAGAVRPDGGRRVHGHDPRQVELGAGAVGREVGDVGREATEYGAAALLAQLDAQGVHAVLGEQQPAWLAREGGVLEGQGGGEVAARIDVEVDERRGRDVEKGADWTVLQGLAEGGTRW